MELETRSRRALFAVSWLHVAIIAMIGVLPGCYVFPFAVPPVRATVATGFAGGTLLARAEPTYGGEQAQRRYGPMAITFRAAAHPLGISDRLQWRPIDFGLGYMVEGYVPLNRAPFTYHGPYFEFGTQPWRLDPHQERGPRFWMSAAGELIMTDLGYGTIYGGGATVSATLEFSGFARSGFAGAGTDQTTAQPRSAGFVLGGASGESGIGVQVATSVRSLGGETFWVATLGLTVRLPAIAGIAGIVDPNGIRFASH